MNATSKQSQSCNLLSLQGRAIDERLRAHARLQDNFEFALYHPHSPHRNNNDASSSSDSDGSPPPLYISSDEEEFIRRQQQQQQNNRNNDETSSSSDEDEDTNTWLRRGFMNLMIEAWRAQRAQRAATGQALF